MATNVTPFPRLPTAPKEINEKYISDLVRALEIFLRQAQNPQLNLQEIPTDGNNNLLSQGDIYIADGGFLKIVGKTPDLVSLKIQDQVQMAMVVQTVRRLVRLTFARQTYPCPFGLQHALSCGGDHG